MDEVNRTLFIPLYGKAQVSRKGILLQDAKAEEIWEKEAFPLRGKAASRWLAYYMAMRARVFDDWTDEMLAQEPEALVLQIGCGMDSRCLRVKGPYKRWIDTDFPDVLALRRRYYRETERYRMEPLDASRAKELQKLPDAPAAIVPMEGVSMYLTNGELKSLLGALREKYGTVRLLMDVYTEWAAKASKYKNPVNEVGVTRLYGVSDPAGLAAGTGLRVKAERSMTPDHLTGELKGWEKVFFKSVLAGNLSRKLYRLYEMESFCE